MLPYVTRQFTPVFVWFADCRCRVVPYQNRLRVECLWSVTGHGEVVSWNTEGDPDESLWQ